ncbi:DHH family phosphoesterase [Clostridiaceae bacterium 14S0207]|nr:DHH family phosphoesterase [Clostridiaceae bacterium 14S0207]
MLKEVIKTLKNSQRIGISFHTSPDGDSLGSSLALLQILRELKKEAYIICKESIPETFNFLPFNAEIEKNITEPLDNTDCIVVLDCGNVERINGNIDLNNDKYIVLNVDHHKSNEEYGKINYVNSEAAAVGEIIYDIMEQLKVTLNKSIATCIYTSLLTDTGSFRHSNTTSKTHNIAGKLISTGFDFSQIHRIIFDNKSLNRIKLYGKIIEDLEVTNNGKIAFINAKKSYFEELNLEDGDTSDLLTFGMKINTVEVVALFKENDDILKVSLRSKQYVDVREIAESYGGGGHIRAAGFASDKPLEQLKNELILKIESYKDERI